MTPSGQSVWCMCSVMCVVMWCMCSVMYVFCHVCWDVMYVFCDACVLSYVFCHVCCDVFHMLCAVMTASVCRMWTTSVGWGYTRTSRPARHYSHSGTNRHSVANARPSTSGECTRSFLEWGKYSVSSLVSYVCQGQIIIFLPGSFQTNKEAVIFTQYPLSRIFCTTKFLFYEQGTRNICWLRHVLHTGFNLLSSCWGATHVRVSDRGIPRVQKRIWSVWAINDGQHLPCWFVWKKNCRIWRK